jgi:hypothetical protein
MIAIFDGTLNEVDIKSRLTKGLTITLELSNTTDSYCGNVQITKIDFINKSNSLIEISFNFRGSVTWFEKLSDVVVKNYINFLSTIAIIIALATYYK